MSETLIEEQRLCEKCNNKPCYQPCADIFRIRLAYTERKLSDIQSQMSLLLHPQLRNSRFDYNARYLRFDEAQQIPEFQKITNALEASKNFVPFKVGNFAFYRRGTGGLWLYVVPEHDFRVPRERKSHKVKQLQKKECSR
jgi:hypothetical protein